MEKNQKTSYHVISSDNQTEFENKITECLNSEEPTFQLIGSLVVQNNTFYQAVLKTEKTTGNPYILMKKK